MEITNFKNTFCVIFLLTVACELFTPRIAEPPLPRDVRKDYFNFYKILNVSHEKFHATDFSRLFSNNFNYEHGNEKYNKDKIKNRLMDIISDIEDSTIVLTVQWFADPNNKDPSIENRKDKDSITIYRKYINSVEVIKEEGDSIVTDLHIFRGNAKFKLLYSDATGWVITYWKDIPENEVLSFFHPSFNLF